MVRRNANGEGSIYRRKDGRYEAAVLVTTNTGQKKRCRVYGNTRQEAHEKLTAIKAQVGQGIPMPDRTWRLGAYLDHWLEDVVRINRRPATHELYEMVVRRYLKPGLGSFSLNRLSVPIVQTFLNKQLADGHSVRKVQIMRTVLSAALTRAVREELLVRNVARLVELPASTPREITPWTATEARHFLSTARAHPLYPAFLLLILYGLRRGEVLGLRWCDVDRTEGLLHIRQQLQRLSSGLHIGPLKTRAGHRDLPLLNLARKTLLAERFEQQHAGTAAATDDAHTERLVFTTQSGHPVEPKNLVRAFHQLCDANGIRRIKLHHLRHTTATLLKDLGVPVRDAQLILGHSQISVTQEIYQHDTLETRRHSLEQIEALFLRQPYINRERCRQKLPSTLSFGGQFLGGPGGARTLDTLLKRWDLQVLRSPLTEVMLAVRDCAMQWLLGRVAVKNCRQLLAPAPVRGPRDLLAFTTSWLNESTEEAPCSAD